MKIKQKNPDRLKWEQFFMALAMLSKMKQGRHGRRPQSTVKIIMLPYLC